MNAADFEAVAYDGAVYCLSCLPDGVDSDSEECSPVFADSEWDCYPTCDACQAEHDYVALTSDGIRWRQSRNWSERMRKALDDHKGKLPAFTSLGSYTMVYYDTDGSEICAKCANNPDLDLALQDCDVYWEGPTVQCAECNDDIESSYGDPEGPDIDPSDTHK